MKSHLIIVTQDNMKFYILGSGSGGNCTIFENNEHDLLMIDCGFSITEIKKRMAKYDLEFDRIKALLITHLHNDHSLSLRAFDTNMVYINENTQMNECNTFDYYETFDLLGYEITTIPASHDSPGTTNFIIKYNNEKLVYITDTGYVHENNKRMINNANQYLIESNHDPRMLMLTRRPMFLKNRIIGANGHLSNADCAETLYEVMGPNTKEIIFLHRSREANSEEMLFDTFKHIMKQREVDISNIILQIAKQDDSICSSF